MFLKASRSSSSSKTEFKIDPLLYASHIFPKLMKHNSTTNSITTNNTTVMRIMEAHSRMKHRRFLSLQEQLLFLNQKDFISTATKTVTPARSSSNTSSTSQRKRKTAKRRSCHYIKNTNAARSVRQVSSKDLTTLAFSHESHSLNKKKNNIFRRSHEQEQVNDIRNDDMDDFSLPSSSIPPVPSVVYITIEHPKKKRHHKRCYTYHNDGGATATSLNDWIQLLQQQQEQHYCQQQQEECDDILLSEKEKDEVFVSPMTSNVLLLDRFDIKKHQNIIDCDNNINTTTNNINDPNELNDIATTSTPTTASISETGPHLLAFA